MMRESAEGFGPKPPKEQPPRNLSGPKDRIMGRALWKADGGFVVPPKV